MRRRRWPKVSDDPQVQRFYEKMRAGGESHNIAEILATRQVPGSNTDRELFANKGTLRDQFRGEEHLLTVLERNARREGVTLNDCSLYEPALARYPLDPKACVPPTEGRSYIRRVCTEYGWACEGVVNVKPSGPTIAELDAQRKEADGQK